LIIFSEYAVSEQYANERGVGEGVVSSEFGMIFPSVKTKSAPFFIASILENGI